MKDRTFGAIYGGLMGFIASCASLCVSNDRIILRIFVLVAVASVLGLIYPKIRNFYVDEDK